MSDELKSREANSVERRGFSEGRPRQESVVRGPQPGVLYACPCCRILTLPERGGYDICPVCFWEDDGQDDHDAAVVRGGSNYELSLEAARRNYAAFGACDERSKQHVRTALPEELRDAGNRVMELPYLRLREEDGRLILRVNDAELLDYIDDFLTEECDLRHDQVDGAGGAPAGLLFPEGTRAGLIVDAIRRLIPAELDRIFRINNPSGGQESVGRRDAR
jgi:hypothetical protein